MSSDINENKYLPKIIDTTNLEIGMTIKNYKQMCDLLNEEVKTGESKKAQLKEWSRYFEFERPKWKQSYIILDIYDEPLEKEDNRKKGGRSVYVKFIETILINYLSQQPDGTKTFTRRNWWELLGMVNKNYNNLSVSEIKSIDKSFTDFEINHFYARSNRKLDSILITALKNLRNRRLIEWEYQTVVIYNKNKYFIANDEEIRNILRIENQILTKCFHMEDVRQIYLQGLQKEYYRNVYKKLYDEYGYERYYKQIKIIYPQDCMKEALPKAEVELQKLLLNEKIVDYLNNEAIKINDSWIDSYVAGETGTYPYIYLKAQQMLVDELIKPISKDKHINIKQLIDFNETNEEIDSLFS